MKLQFITAVAAFLLYSVVAKKTGPANVLTPPRRLSESSVEGRAWHSIGGRIVEASNQIPIKPRRSWTRNFRVTRVSSTPKTIHDKFSSTTTLGDPLKHTGRYPKHQRSDVRDRRRSSLPEFHLARRSHHPTLKFSDHVISLEPVFSHSGHSLLHSGSDHKLGPLIGPVKFPGIGRKVYIRLVVSPDDETSSHVTLHLVNNEPVETFHDIHDHGDVVQFEKPKPSFPHEKLNTFAPIPPKEVIVTEESGKFNDSPVNHLDFAPSNIKAFEFYEDRKHPEIPQNMNGLQNQLIHNHPQYLAAPNHHQLPIAFRPVENLNNLPIYPPLSTADQSGVQKERDNGGKVEDPATHSQQDMESVSDVQQSASFKHTWASPDYTKLSTAWNPVSVFGPRRPEVTVNRRESPASEFMEEVRAPDFRFSQSFSWPIESRGKSLNSTVHPNSGEIGFLNVQLKGETTTATTSTTSDAGNPEGEIRSTTLSSLTSTAASSSASAKGMKK